MNFECTFLLKEHVNFALGIDIELVTMVTLMLWSASSAAEYFINVIFYPYHSKDSNSTKYVIRLWLFSKLFVCF